MIWLFVFKYLPLWGWTIAFQDFKPAKKIFDQEWVGLRHFTFLFQDEHFLRVMRNTLAMSFINLVLGFVTAIVLAILLNELRNLMFKRVVQTISYLPHFISWVVAASIISTALSADGGIINELLMWFGIIKEPILWLGKGIFLGNTRCFGSMEECRLEHHYIFGGHDDDRSLAVRGGGNRWRRTLSTDLEHYLAGSKASIHHLADHEYRQPARIRL